LIEKEKRSDWLKTVRSGRGKKPVLGKIPSYADVSRGHWCSHTETLPAEVSENMLEQGKKEYTRSKKERPAFRRNAGGVGEGEKDRFRLCCLGG